MWPYPAFGAHARWTKEQPRKACALGMQDRKVDFGSCYERQYEDYTCEEYYAPQGHKDRVHTADLTPQDIINRELKDGDSLKDSDWRERTGQSLLRLGMVSSDLKPNRNKAMIYFEAMTRNIFP